MQNANILITNFMVTILLCFSLAAATLVLGEPQLLCVNRYKNTNTYSLWWCTDYTQGGKKPLNIANKIL